VNATAVFDVLSDDIDEIDWRTCSHSTVAVDIGSSVGPAATADSAPGTRGVVGSSRPSLGKGQHSTAELRLVGSSDWVMGRR
jgi:hypothetical protein